jgi:SPRY domain-containing SOCS box protein 3
MSSELPAECQGRAEFVSDDWTWSSEFKSPEAILSSDKTSAYFHVDPLLESFGTAGVRGKKGFKDGEHYWEVALLEPAYGTSVMIGVCTKQAQLHAGNYNYVNLIGKDATGWGLSYKGTFWHNGVSRQFCPPFFEASTVIGVHLNLYEGTLSFYINGQFQGVACQGLNLLGEELYPMISSTATGTELQVGLRKCRYFSLQEKCYHALARSLQHRADVDILPLPKIFKEHLCCLTSH